MAARLFRVGKSAVGGPEVVGGGLAASTGLAGTLASASGFTATLHRGTRLAATLDSSSGISATLRRGTQITATLAVTSTLTAALHSGTRLTTTFAATSGMTAGLHRPTDVAGTLASTSGMSVTLTVGARLAAPLSSTSTFAVNLHVQRHLTASFAATSTMTVAALHTLRHLSGTLASTSSLTATIWAIDPIVTGTWTAGGVGRGGGVTYRPGAPIVFAGVITLDINADWIEITADTSDINTAGLTITVDHAGGPTLAPITSGPWYIPKVAAGDVTYTIQGSARTGTIGPHQCISIRAREAHSAVRFGNYYGGGIVPLGDGTADITPEAPLYTPGDSLILVSYGYSLIGTPPALPTPSGWTLREFSTNDSLSGGSHEYLQTWTRVSDGSSLDLPTMNLNYDTTVFPVARGDAVIYSVKGSGGSAPSSIADVFTGAGTFTTTDPGETPPGTVVRFYASGASSSRPASHLTASDLFFVEGLDFFEDDNRQAGVEAISTPAALPGPGDASFHANSGVIFHTLVFDLDASDLFITSSHPLTQCFDIVGGWHRGRRTIGNSRW